VPVKTTLPDAASQAWPMGDAPSRDAWPAGIDRARIAKAVDLAFSDPSGLTAALVVVYKGQIVGEGTPAQLKDNVSGGRVTEIEVFGVDDPTVARLVRRRGGRTPRRRSLHPST